MCYYSKPNGDQLISNRKIIGYCEKYQKNLTLKQSRKCCISAKYCIHFVYNYNHQYWIDLGETYNTEAEVSIFSDASFCQKTKNFKYALVIYNKGIQENIVTGNSRADNCIVAERRAVIQAIQYAKNHFYNKNICIYTDCQSITKKESYCKNGVLAKDDNIEIAWIPREQNRYADRLSKFNSVNAS